MRGCKFLFFAMIGFLGLASMGQASVNEYFYTCLNEEYGKSYTTRVGYDPQQENLKFYWVNNQPICNFQDSLDPYYQEGLYVWFHPTQDLYYYKQDRKIVVHIDPAIASFPRGILTGRDPEGTSYYGVCARMKFGPGETFESPEALMKTAKQVACRAIRQRID